MNIHEKLMSKCLNLAKKAGSDTLPNPLVGSVIVKNGEIIGKGFHKRFGKPHAEVEAINNTKVNPEGSDLYVNLEPCSHYGKTPPCTELIINSKIKNVFIGTKDPNPLVAGRGIKRLIENGINVKTGILEKKCRELNEAFIKIITEKKSFITLKTASTLDGKTAQSDGFSKWITCEKSRKHVHTLRFLSDAIMVGGNTIRADNPFLNVRKGEKVLKEPLKIIVSKSLDFKDTLNVFKNRDKVLFITSESESNKNKFKDIKRIYLPLNENQELDFSNLDKIMFDNGIFNIFAEGGSTLHLNLLKYNLIDKFYIFLSNKIVGGNNNIPMFSGNSPFSIKKPYKVKTESIQRFNDDLMIKAYPLER